jgi:isopentenyl diphosphate isomerase/L-lactate dehydrogenase-like FMN-dependent dehydrogenase
MTAIANIEDLRCLAYKRLTRVLFDFVDGGAQNETTLRANQTQKVTSPSIV